MCGAIISVLHGTTYECGAKRLRVYTCVELSSRGAGVGVVSYQDTPPVRPCRLFLDVLSRKVLVRHYPHTSFNPTAVHLSETIALCFRTEPRVCGTLLQDRTRQEAEYRATQGCA